jgi:hypothetical protein
MNKVEYNADNFSFVKKETKKAGRKPKVVKSEESTNNE